MCSVQTFASVCVQVKHPYVLEQFSSCLHFYVQFLCTFLFCFSVQFCVHSSRVFFFVEFYVKLSSVGFFFFFPFCVCVCFCSFLRAPAPKPQGCSWAQIKTILDS